jgi:integrase
MAREAKCFIKTDTIGKIPVYLRLQQEADPKNIIRKIPALTVSFDRAQQKQCKAQTTRVKRGAFPDRLDSWDKANEKALSILALVEASVSSEAAKHILTSKDVKDIIERVVYKPEREEAERIAQQKAEEEAAAKKICLLDYYDQFCSRKQRRTDLFFRQGLNKLTEYGEERGFRPDWDDITPEMLDDFRIWVESKGLNANTVHAVFRSLKAVMRQGWAEGKTDNPISNSKKFNGIQGPVDKIYLTEEEVDAIRKVELTPETVKAAGRERWSRSFEIARDMFLVGIATAQRFSDFRNIKPDDIITEEETTPDGKTVVRHYINFRQKKTGKSLTIPASNELLSILQKYNYNLPRPCLQTFNDHLKTIAKMAGITDKQLITKIEGGKKIEQYIERWELVSSHTCRRTAITQMFLKGWPMQDVMLMSGHESTATMQKYIKATSKERGQKVASAHRDFLGWDN